MSARADDWYRDLMSRRTQRFCPLVYGPACRISLHLDLAVAYQRGWVNQTTTEHVRFAGVVGLLGRLADSSHLHLGGEVEVGGQAGDPVAAFHVVPRVRLRYFPGRSPVTLEVGLGPMYQRSDLEIHRLGGSAELSAGILGLFSVITGGELLQAVGASAGTEAHFYVGGRLSLLSILYVLLSK
jgi:hypothetical protein